MRSCRRSIPQRTIRLVLCPELLGTNGKVSNLVQMLGSAKYDYILINDSDIKVSPNYLRRIMGCFLLPKRRGGRVGLVTALYRGQAHGTIGSRMEALGIATDFIAGVLTARQIEDGIRFGLGSTLAVSRQALEAIGGLEPLVDYLADDYELGARVWRNGFEVMLSGEVVETFLPAYRFRQFLAHQIRWSRSTRYSRKLGYTGMVFTYGLPWALCNLIASGASLSSIALLSLTLLARVALALAVGCGRAGRSPGNPRSMATARPRRSSPGHLDLELRRKHSSLARPTLLPERRQNEPPHRCLAYAAKTLSVKREGCAPGLAFETWDPPSKGEYGP